MDDFIKGDTLLIKDLTDEINKLRQDNYKLSDELSTTKIALAKKEQERLDTLNDNKYYKNLCSELTQQLTETNKLMQEYLNKCLSLEQQLEQKTSFGKFKSAEELLKAYENLEREFTKSKQQLAERQKKTNFKICRMCEQEFEQLQNQTAIAKLEKVKAELEFTSNNNEWITARDDRILNGICDYIDQQIKELKGETNEQKA